MASDCPYRIRDVLGPYNRRLRNSAQSDLGMSMSAPLEGITVLEMGSSLAGPYGARLLADFGARVIKVEAPGGGDAARSWGKETLAGTSATYQALNFGKRSIVVDFKNDVDVGVLKKFIAAEADVVLQNLRPGIADELGLGPTDVTQLNSRIIYCNISAFGRSGPYAQMPGYDPLIQAFCGIVDLTGPADGKPARVGVPIIDLGTGLWAALGVMAALQARARTGKGSIVDAAMADTAMAYQTVSQATIEAGGPVPKRSGLTGPLLVPNTGYQTSDGLLIVTVGTDRQFEKLCDVIGKPELAHDERFRTNIARMEHEGVLREELEAVFRNGTRAHWSKLLNSANVPNAPIQNATEVLGHEHTQAAGIVKPAPDGSFGLVANALKLDGQRPGFESLAPELGEATDDVLAKYRDG